ncbi:MAG: DNA internalization-related competence protein ComEC/Rec2 [Deltaproteobacteria bacterium]|nr:DNA internalization-related competence protein ComEC/Rec2 [Deltaproteobacteria bacterium]
MTILFSRPLLWALVGAGLGICLAHADIPLKTNPWIVLLAGLLWVFLWRHFFSEALLRGVLVINLVALSIIGGAVSYSHHEKSDLVRESISLPWSGVAWVEVASACMPYGDQVRMLVRLKTIQDNEKISAQGLVKLTVVTDRCEWVKGDLLKIKGKLKAILGFKNPYSFDSKAYWENQGVHASMFLSKPELIEVVNKSRYISRFLETYRLTLIQDLQQFLSGYSQKIFQSLLLGTPIDSKEGLAQGFQTLGLTHVLVVSGFHLVLFGASFFYPLYFIFSLWPLLAERGLAFKLALLTSFIPTLVYALLTGWNPPVARSAVMMGLGLGVILIGRIKDALTIFCFTALCLLIVQPKLLLDLSFQLSALATLTLILFLPPCHRQLQTAMQKTSLKPRFQTLIVITIDSLASTMAIQVVLYPFLVNSFGRFSLLAPLANLILGPLISFIILPIGFYALFFMPKLWGFGILAGLARFFEPLWVYLSTHFTSSIFCPLVPPVQGFGWVIYGCLALGILLWAHPSLAKKFFLIGAAFFILNYSFSWGKAYCFPPRHMTVTMFDVGQGDALLIQLPGGPNLLIDGGGLPFSNLDIGQSVLAPELLGRGIHQLDYVVLTHPDADHAKGLGFVLKNFRVGEFWWNGKGSLLEDVKLAGVRDRVLQAGETFALGKAIVQVVHAGSEAEDDNNASLVLRLCWRQVCFLSTGDIAKDAETLILEQNQVLVKSQILKIPHHGSKTSSLESFLDQVNPQIALLSVGENNPYHLPNRKIMERYQSKGIKILRTDQNGEITLKTDGEKIYYNTFNGDQGIVPIR